VAMRLTVPRRRAQVGRVRALRSMRSPGRSVRAVANTMTTTRKDHTATSLLNWKVLVVGGVDEANNILPSAELYE